MFLKSKAKSSKKKKMGKGYKPAIDRRANLKLQ